MALQRCVIAYTVSEKPEASDPRHGMAGVDSVAASNLREASTGVEQRHVNTCATNGPGGSIGGMFELSRA